MSTIWRKLAKDKRYREEFAIAMLKRMIPYQTRAIRRKRGWSQAQLAQESNLTQGVISRAEDPDYGNLTLSTIGRIAAGYDLAAIVRFVPFSELVRFSETLSENEFSELPTFDKEDEKVGAPTLSAPASMPEKKVEPQKRRETGQQLAASGKGKMFWETRDNVSEEAKELARSLVESGGGTNNEIGFYSSR